jgi:hypothetical protein
MCRLVESAIELSSTSATMPRNRLQGNPYEYGSAKEPQTTHRGTLNLIPYERGQSGNPGGGTKEFVVGLRKTQCFLAAPFDLRTPLLHEIPGVRIRPSPPAIPSH